MIATMVRRTTPRLSRMLLGMRKGSSSCSGVAGVGAGGGEGGRSAGGDIGRSCPTGVGWGTGGGGMGVWSMRVRHVLWLLLLWMVCGLHLLYLFASHGVQELTEPVQTERKGGISAHSAEGALGLSHRVLTRSSRDVELEQERTWYRGQLDQPQAGGEEQKGKSIQPYGGTESEQSRDILRVNIRDIGASQIRGPHIGGQQMRRLAVIDTFTKSLPDTEAFTTQQESSAKYNTPLHLASNPSGGDERVEVVPTPNEKNRSPRTLLDGNNTSLTAHFNPPSPKDQNLNIQSATTSNNNAWLACTSVSPPLPRGSLDEPEWQPVRQGQSYVFSAFHDPRELVTGRKVQHRVIRVISITDTRVDGAPQFCQLWYRRKNNPQAQGQGHSEEGHLKTGRIHYAKASFNHPKRQQPVTDTQESRHGRLDLVVVPAISDIVPETHGLRFAPFIYTCRLTSDAVPVGVSLTHTRCEAPLNFLPIHSANRPAHATNYTVCVTPFNMKYNNTLQLVEKIETDRTFGANKFIFYNYSSGPAIQKYIQSYQKEGIAQVIPWNLPVKVDTWPAITKEVDIHYFGQLAALNDCLYRSMLTSKMIIFTDMDEIIVPKKHRTWRELVKFLIYKGQGSAGTFIFQNAFFRTEWPDDKSFIRTSLTSSSSFGGSPNDLDSVNVISMVKTKREKYIYPWGLRSKYICDPLKVEMVGVHNVWRFVNDSYTELDVPSDIGLLHHYRSWNRPEETNSVIDRSMHRYKDTITSKILQRHRLVRSNTRLRHPGFT